MAFLAPLFLFGAVAAAVPIVLHLLKREPEARLRFSAVKLLRRAPVEHTRRRHLNELVLLLLRVAALLLLTLAFARPFFTSGAASAIADVTIVAVDTSLSLSAPGQFGKARQQAHDALASAPSNALVGVVTFADTAQPVARPAADRAVARAAVEAAVPGYGATRYRAALHAAVDMAAGRSGTIVVVTDMQANGWAEGDRASVPDSLRVEVRDIGGGPPNFAVTAARIAGNRTIAVVSNTAAVRREARVEMIVDGKPAGEATAAIGPNESAEVALPAAEGRSAAVSVHDPDGIQGDNIRYLVVDGGSRPRVLVVTTSGDLEREGFYLRHAIAAAGRHGAVYDVEGAGAAQLATWDRARLDAYAAIAVLSTRGLDRAGRELLLDYVRGGHGMFVAAGPNIDGEVAAGALGGALSIAAIPAALRDAERSFSPTDRRHPVFQPFGGGATLGLVKFRRVAAIGGEACDSLARFSAGEAAMVECRLGAGRVLAFASDLDNAWNDFPLHASFVPFVHESVRYLASPRGQAGEILIGDAPAGVPAEPGIADVAGRPVALNVDPAEAAAGRLSVEEFQSSVVPVKQTESRAEAVAVQQQEERQHVWQYLLGLMVAMLALESVVSARTS